MNRLADSQSPYLLQHAGNPVDWFEWGADAFAEAARRDVPILLSIGYSACHWCHVMAHESFDDPATARLINDGFVAIKVDREERPDVDSVYMEATQALTRQGGWPMTVFATPSGDPFFCGTYFPREHFQRLLRAVGDAWRSDRAEVVEQGQKIVAALTESGPGFGTGPAPDAALLDAAVAGLRSGFDDANGGFGAAPKFPPSMVVEFLLRTEARTGSPDAADMTRRTLTAMAAGGMYDQLGGGFARYSVDATWTVPHFEKMLYDNALLARVYAHWWRQAADPDDRALARRVAVETCDWMVAGLRTPEGAFASALDADSEGAEGKYYVWTPVALRESLGDADGAYAAEVFGVTESGTFEYGASVLQLRTPPADPERFARVRDALLAVRSERVPPARDDKVVAAWNGLAIAALAEVGALFDRPDLIDAARAAAAVIDDVHVHADGAESRLTRTSLGGAAGANAGVLEDYGDVAEGLLALYSVTGEARWSARAGDLLAAARAHFADGAGGFFDTADDAEALFRRPQDPTDNATPSGQFALAAALLAHSALTGAPEGRDAAAAALAPVTALAPNYPRFCGWGMAAAEALLAGPVEIAVVGDAADPRTSGLHRAALSVTSAGTVVARGEPGVPATVPLLEGRDPVDGAPAAYVCRDFACRMPVTTPEALAAEIG
ncbi:MAG TPA: thioredoxin domain-containing protein [Streptosporangiaceae bacterium]|jgi:hypothetical protein